VRSTLGSDKLVQTVGVEIIHHILDALRGVPVTYQQGVLCVDHHNIIQPDYGHETILR
jgi:hypothetical protein